MLNLAPKPFLGAEGMPGTPVIRHLWKKAKDHAKVRKLPFSLKTQDVRDLMEASGGRCAVSGLRFDYLYVPQGCRRRPFGPSIDRINCTLGYETGNVRLVCNIVNQAMGEWGAEELYRVAEAMVLKRQKS